MDHENRIVRVRNGLGEAGIDALLVTNLSNVRYLTGFSGTNGQVLITGERAEFFSDPRYKARASMLVRGAEVVIYPEKLTKVLPEHTTGIAKLGVEAETMTLDERDKLDAALDSVELAPTTSIVEKLRRVKEPAELELIRSAVQVADEAFEHILDRLVPGARERDIALDLEVHMRRNGADDVSFEPIVGSGPLSAHIHHTASDREFEKGDLVLMDFGAQVGGYCSDMTRTVVLGSASDEQQAVYATVLEAQRRGVDAARAGRKCVDVDAAARSFISDAGHGDAFAHGLGHGVGLDIHEAPSLYRFSEDTLAAREVVTIEPGIYTESLGGIRIEDCVAVTDNGAEVLGGARKDVLIEL